MYDLHFAIRHGVWVERFICIESEAETRRESFSGRIHRARARTNSNQNMNLNQLNGCKRIKWILPLRVCNSFHLVSTAAAESSLPWQASHERTLTDPFLPLRCFSVCFGVDFAVAAAVVAAVVAATKWKKRFSDFNSSVPYVFIFRSHGIAVRTRQITNSGSTTTTTKQHSNPLRLMVSKETHSIRVPTAELCYSTTTTLCARVFECVVPCHAFGNLIANKLKCDLFSILRNQRRERDSTHSAHTHSIAQKASADGGRVCVQRRQQRTFENKVNSITRHKRVKMCFRIECEAKTNGRVPRVHGERLGAGVRTMRTKWKKIIHENNADDWNEKNGLWRASLWQKCRTKPHFSRLSWKWRKIVNRMKALETRRRDYIWSSSPF